jgi:hypothetical protein
MNILHKSWMRIPLASSATWTLRPRDRRLSVDLAKNSLLSKSNRSPSMTFLQNWQLKLSKTTFYPCLKVMKRSISRRNTTIFPLELNQNGNQVSKQAEIQLQTPNLLLVKVSLSQKQCTVSWNWVNSWPFNWMNWSNGSIIWENSLNIPPTRGINIRENCYNYSKSINRGAIW